MNSKKKLSFFVKFSVVSSASLYLINKLLFIKSTSKERLYSSNSNFYNWKFGKIFYTVRGTGSPILLIHDLTCESSDYEWKNVVNAFAKNHTVYTLDLIGCGRSDKPKITYTNYLYVQLISDFIKNVIKHKVRIISTGLSSSASIMTCYIEPQLIENLILINPKDMSSLCKFPKANYKLLKRLLEIPLIGTFIYNINYSNILIRKRFSKLYFNDPANVTKRTVQAYSEAAHLGGPSAKYLMSSICSNYVNININHALKEINIGIQIILGENLPQAESIKSSYRDLNPSVEIDTISNSKLLPQIENPEEFVSTCDIYL